MIDMLTLCSFCIKAHSGFELGKCHICNGQLEQVDGWIEQAGELLGERKIFCLSTQLPKEWLAKEEEIFDRSIHGETIKQAVNKHIIQSLQKKGKKYFTEAPYRLQFDFFHGLVQIANEPIFFFGYYKKFVMLSQSRWMCRNCNGNGCGECKGKGKRYDAVEEKIGEVFKQHCKAENYILHASGREDVDAFNTGGRPFVLEVENPEEHLIDLIAIAREIDKAGEVKVEGLRQVRRNVVTLVSDSHFDKEYEAEIVFETEAGKGKEIEEKIYALEGQQLQLEQRTPERVAHRRADLIRKRSVQKIRILGLDIEKKKAKLLITTEAGTYIKEFVSGDNGRTAPSLKSLLGSDAKCEKLTVTKIYDEFLQMILGKN